MTPREVLVTTFGTQHFLVLGELEILRRNRGVIETCHSGIREHE